MRKPDVDLEVLRTVIEEMFPPARSTNVERVVAGGSSQVYRIRRDAAVYYLRFAEQPGESLAPEARVHELLRERGVRAPKIVHRAPTSTAFGRSFMVTSEIAGRPVAECSDRTSVRRILTEAGKDLAIINKLPVDGFGFLRRDRVVGSRLQGPFSTHCAWVSQHLDEDLHRIAGRALLESEVWALRHILQRYEAWLQEDQVWLAHGDFDTTHIFQQDGRYTGIIDFGEVRGTEP
ncbi:MAG: aminoglycoside phosphotransferase family protein [Chloroflexota bacterium]|nr:aminoglycoside phosphotransferase family protein [Chloroflexota bacterium]